MIVSIGKSFLFGIVFDAGALLRDNVLLAVPPPGFRLVRSAAVAA
jgi:hypothetical protein